MEEGRRNLDVTTSSMNVMALNNLVVSMRSSVKQARVQIINKLTHQIRLYRKKKGSEEQMKKFQKKADRLKSEIDTLKHIKIDQASKNALASSVSFEDAAKEGNIERRAIARLASHKLLQPKVEKFQKEHDDWKSLAAFLLSKNTGRRFKKKKIMKMPKDAVASVDTTGIGEKQKQCIETCSESSDISGPEEVEAQENDGQDDSASSDDEHLSPMAQLSSPGQSNPPETYDDPLTDSDDSQDNHMTIPCVPTTVLPSKLDWCKEKRESVTPLRKTTKQEDSKQSPRMLDAAVTRDVSKDEKPAKKGKLKRNTKTIKNVNPMKETSEMVVQTLNLDELNSESDIVVKSDFTVDKQEQDLLFPNSTAGRNDSCTKKPKKKTKDPFFVCESGSEENETSSEDGDAGTEGTAGETEKQSLGRKISKNMVQSSFVDTLSRSDLSRIKEKQVSSRRMHEEKQKPNVGGKTFNQAIQNVGDRKRLPGKHFHQQKENSTKGKPQHSGGPKVAGQPKKEPETKLHPSWEASKKRKQQLAGVTAFCGKKIKFDDDS